jgi:hypothetical protein
VAVGWQWVGGGMADSGSGWVVEWQTVIMAVCGSVRQRMAVAVVGSRSEWQWRWLTVTVV